MAQRSPLGEGQGGEGGQLDCDGILCGLGLLEPVLLSAPRADVFICRRVLCGGCKYCVGCIILALQKR